MSRRKWEDPTARLKPTGKPFESVTIVEAVDIESKSAIFPGERYTFPNGEVGARQLGLPAPRDRPDLDAKNPAVLFSRLMGVAHQDDGVGVPEYLGVIGEAYLFAREVLAVRGHHRSDKGAHWGITNDCHPELGDRGLGPLSCLDGYQTVEAFENLLFQHLRKEPKPGQATDISTAELRDILDLAARVGLFAGRLQARGAEQYARTGQRQSEGGKESAAKTNRAQIDKSNKAAREYIRRIRDVDRTDWPGIRRSVATESSISPRTIDNAVKRLALDLTGAKVRKLCDATMILLERIRVVPAAYASIFRKGIEAKEIGSRVYKA